MHLVLWLALVAAVPAAPVATVPVESDPAAELANTDEVRHQVTFKLIAPDVATFTVTRAFAPRAPSDPMRLDRQLVLPDQSVVTSFAVRTDGAWREGRLGPKNAPNAATDKAPAKASQAAARAKPSASLEGQGFGEVRLATPAFRSASGIEVRYTLWAQAVASRGGRRWIYCGGDQNEGDKDERVMPDISLPAGSPGLQVSADQESESCLVVEKTEPDAKAPSVRFGAYQLGPHAWWWRLELAVPEKAAEIPTPPDSASVVFVLDASRSQEPNGGLAHQLAIVASYLKNTPDASVELVLASRTAERVFNRFVPAGGFEQALPTGLAKRTLGNGSCLDCGAQLAVAALSAAGKPGRIVLMTDGVVRSRLQRTAVEDTLRRAPAGTIVHVVYPSSGTSNEAISHNVPDGIDELVASFGGGSYNVNVNRSRKDGSLRAPAPEMLRSLVKPDALESLELSDASATKMSDKKPDEKAEAAAWLDALGDDHAVAGEDRVWSGISDTPPPKRLALTGWVWAKKVRMPIRPDPGFQQRLARLVSSENTVMECQETTQHQKDALTQRFLAPELVFRVPGDGAPEDIGTGGNDTATSCGGGLSGSHVSAPPPKAQELLPLLGNVLHRCGLVSDAGGGIRVGVETDRLEILDVTVDGGEDWQRQCVEDGIWSVRLPTSFNDGHSQAVMYSLTLAHKK